VSEANETLGPTRSDDPSLKATNSSRNLKFVALVIKRRSVTAQICLTIIRRFQRRILVMRAT